LREGSPEVLELLAKNPFQDEPPSYVRGVLYDYRFTTRAERSASGRGGSARGEGFIKVNPKSERSPKPKSEPWQNCK
jgi:hypothetical protein